ncbi:hypothetical protein [Streptomyces sp. CoH17]|uniref:hypothetical protein n=1 Tax=Streptomyces sp. CoH17 TaxID=2992806 RepID=UPI002270FC08|nr:hypothetical protein [Streptomyces sp. CoH17]
MPVAPTGQFVYSQKLRQAALVRKQISQYSQDLVGVRIADVHGVSVDPDSGTLKLNLFQMWDFENQEAPGEQVETDASEANGKLTKLETGIFEYVVQPAVTSKFSTITAHWTYELDGNAFSFVDYYQVLDYMPTYAQLLPSEQNVVQQITWMLGDLFDSSEGGPHLAEQFQSHYGYERIAQLMHIAVNKINMTRQPLTTFKVGQGPGGNFPENWYGLLVQGTYIEVLKHLVRSYVEQPEILNLNVTAASRRDYFMRWQSVLEEEKEDFERMVLLFKRKQMGLGNPSMIVAGGIFGGGSGIFTPSYSAAARAFRFYPASFSVGWRASTG